MEQPIVDSVPAATCRQVQEGATDPSQSSVLIYVRRSGCLCADLQNRARLVRFQCLTPTIKSKDSMSEEKHILNNWAREPKVVAQISEFYISGEIEDPECYIDIFDIIRHAQHNDTVKIYLNSTGGSLFTAIQFLRVLMETSATVIVSIEGAAMSAATLLFLAADSVEITPHSSIMLHDYSGGMWGKGGDLHRQVQHERLWTEKLFREVYEDFLSIAELDSLMDGKEIWLTSDETIKRLETRTELRKQAAELEEATRP